MTPPAATEPGAPMLTASTSRSTRSVTAKTGSGAASPAAIGATITPTHMEARKLSDGSGWHMTIRNDDRIWTHACCRQPGPPATEDDARKYGYEPGEPTIGKPHASHATRQEAEDCYHRWRLAEVERTLEFDDAVFGDWVLGQIGRVTSSVYS